MQAKVLLVFLRECLERNLADSFFVVKQQQLAREQEKQDALRQHHNKNMGMGKGGRNEGEGKENGKATGGKGRKRSASMSGFLVDKESRERHASDVRKREAEHKRMKERPTKLSNRWVEWVHGICYLSAFCL